MDEPLVEIAAADEEVLDADRPDPGGVARVFTRPNDGRAEEGVLVAQPVDRGTGQRQDPRAAAGRDAHGVDGIRADDEHRVEVTRHEALGGVVVADLLRPHGLRVDPVRVEDQSRRERGAASHRSQADSTPVQAGHVLDAGPGAHDEMKGRLLQDRDAAKAIESMRVTGQRAGERDVGHVGVGERDVRGAALQGDEVLDRPGALPLLDRHRRRVVAERAGKRLSQRVEAAAGCPGRRAGRSSASLRAVAADARTLPPRSARAGKDRGGLPGASHLSSLSGDRRLAAPRTRFQPSLRSWHVAASSRTYSISARVETTALHASRMRRTLP